LIRTAVGRVFTKYFGEVNFQPVIQWFELGGELKLPELAPTDERYRQLSKIQGLSEHVGRLGATDTKNHATVAAASEMILEGLWAHRRIGRSEERGYYAEKQKPQEPRETPSSRGPRRQFN
jgi:magnesium chelatase subunit I